MNTRLPRIYDDLDKLLQPNKVIAIMGPRRVGKTSLVKKYLETTPYRYRFDTGDDISIHQILSSQRLSILEEYVGNNQLIVIDEAHLIPNIGMNLKLIVDQIPDIRVLVTGSGSFDLQRQIGEPLVGRKFTYQLHPLSLMELVQTNSRFDLTQQLESHLIYGMYPDVLTASYTDEKHKILAEITHSYLFKDILIFEGLKNSSRLFNLLQLLAFQIGAEVSLTELGNALELDKKTIARYLDILEQTYIITPLRPYFLNRRKSVMKKNKYYFIDLGIRNTIVGNYNSLSRRNDVGQLWENFLVMERLKKQAYSPIYASNYFWRTWDHKEVDWVEMREGKLFGYEFKWTKDGGKHKKAWLSAYPDEAEFMTINQENYLDFVT